MLLARRNLTHDRVRLILSITGVALSVMLILLLAGYLAGIYRQASAYLENAPGSVVVAQRGVRTFAGSSSFLSPEILGAVRATPGVERAVPIVMLAAVLELHDRKEIASLVGYDPSQGGGPWKLADGQVPAADDEVVVDRVLANQHGIAVGTAVRILDRQFTVVGLSEGTSLWIGSYAFARAAAVQGLLRAPGVWSAIFVMPAAGVSEADVVQAVSIPGVEAFAKIEKIEADRKGIARIYDAPLGLMVAIAFVVGVLVVGLVIYTATIERRREYGALKAIGMRNRTLYRLVASQALIAAVAGGLLGVALAVGVGALLNALRPQFPVVIELEAIAKALAASLAMAVIAALAPARAMAGLAPAEVFR
ncbi:MAG TPA: FtsX-like permease family protein [Candidatus Limnocylindrales bacterium]|nr:FtsX-like permease family protein [Candidatus Limnocylindrales bacterium]